MAKRKSKATTYRRHRDNTPYKRRKGVLETVKDWLTPSKWINPWEEDQQEEEDMIVYPERPPSQDGSIKPPSTNQPMANNNDMIITSDDHHHQIPYTTINNGEKEEELDKVTPILHINQKHARHPLEGPTINGIPNPSSLLRYKQQNRILPETTPSFMSTHHSRMFTSTPCVTDGLLHRHIDTPRPPLPVKTRQNEQTSSSIRPSNRPSFSVSTFHSPTRNLTNLSISRSPFLSPFYSGRTMYGGIANRNNTLFRKRPRLTTTPPDDLHQPVKQVIKPHPHSSTTTDRPTSQTARKILDTLHSISSPLNDARKLPLRVASPAKRMRLEKPFVKSPPPVSSLSSPAPPSISTIKQPLVVPSERNVPRGTKTVSIDLTNDPLPVTNTSSTSIPSPSLLPPPISPSCGKIRTKRHSTHYSHKRKDMDGEEPPPVPPSFLTNPVPLKLPSSMCTIPLMGISTYKSTISPSIIQSMAMPTSVQTTPTSPYSFTSPVPVVSEPSVQTAPIMIRGKFEFSTPKVVTALKTDQSSAATPQPSSAIPPPLKTGSVLEALKLPKYQLENIRKETRSSDSIKVTLYTDEKKRTEMSPLSLAMSTSNTATIHQSPPNTVSLVLSTSRPLSSFSVSPLSLPSTKNTTTAMGVGVSTGVGLGASLGTGVSLGANLGTGVSLGASLGTGPSFGSTEVSLGTGVSTTAGGIRISLSSSSSSSSSIITTSGNSDKWECTECWAHNPSDITSCACCTTARVAITAPPSTQTVTMPKLLIPGDSNKWECPACMLLIKPELQMCPACNEKRPSSVVTSSTPVSNQGMLPILGPSGGLQLGQGGGLKLGESSGLKLGDGGGLKLNQGSGLKLGDNSGLKLGDGGGLKLSQGSGLKLSDNSGLKLGDGGGLKLNQGSGLKLGDNSGLELGQGSGLKLGESSGLQLGDSGGLKLGQGGGLKLGESSGPKLGDGGGLKLGQGGGLKLGQGGGLKLGQSSGLKLGESSGLHLGPGGGIKLSQAGGINSVDGGLKLSQAGGLKIGESSGLTGSGLVIGKTSTASQSLQSAVSGTSLSKESSIKLSAGANNVLCPGGLTLGNTGLGASGSSQSDSSKLGNTNNNITFSSLQSLGGSEPGGLRKQETAQPRLPTLSLISTNKQSTITTPTSIGISIPTTLSKLPTLTPFTSSSTGILIPKPNITNQSLAGLSFEMPPPKTQQQSMTPSMPISNKPNVSLTFPTAQTNLSASTFSIPTHISSVSATTTAQSIFGSSQQQFSFGQGQNPLQPGSTSSFGNSTSGNLFNLTTTTFPISTSQTSAISSLNQSTGLFNQNIPKTSQQPFTSSTGFNFSQFNQSGPSMNFGGGSTIFGDGQPSMSNTNPTTTTNKLFEFGSSQQPQQQQQQPSFQFTTGHSSLGGGASNPTLGGRGKLFTGASSGREVRKAKRRLK